MSQETKESCVPPELLANPASRNWPESAAFTCRLHWAHPSPAWQVVVYRCVGIFFFLWTCTPTKEQLPTAFRLRDRGTPAPPTHPSWPVLLFIPNWVF